MEPSQFDTKHLNKICEKIEHKAKWFQEREAYAKGVNPVIFQELPKSAPDFRIPVPFVKKAISQYVGYMFKPGAITYSGKFFDSTVKQIFDENDEALITAMDVTNALAYGKCYELHWADKDGKEKLFYPLPTEQGLPVFSDDLRKKLIGFYWLRKVDDDTEGETHVLTYYDDVAQYEWRKAKGANDWLAVDPVRHAYGQVPVNIGYVSIDQTNLFDHVKEIIDLYDKLMSVNLANESQKFANAILLLAQKLDDQTVDETGRTMVDRFNELMMFDGLGESPDKQASYLTKNIPTDFIKFVVERAYDHIHDMIPILDQRDTKVGVASGAAQEQRHQDFELKCSDIEANFSRFLQNRIKLLAGATAGLGGDAEGAKEVSIKFTRNIPKNNSQKIDDAMKLYGTLPDKVWLDYLPDDVVPDREATLALMAANKPEVTMPDASADAVV